MGRFLKPDTRFLPNDNKYGIQKENEKEERDKTQEEIRKLFKILDDIRAAKMMIIKLGELDD